jgi:hypothetical protein
MCGVVKPSRVECGPMHCRLPVQTISEAHQHSAACQVGERVGAAQRPPARGYGTHSLRRTKANHRECPIIYKTTGDLRVVWLLLVHTKIESSVHYLGISVEDVLTLAEHTEAQKPGDLGTNNLGPHPI